MEQVGRDCQEIEPSVGAQLLALLYALGDSAMMALVDEGSPEAQPLLMGGDTYREASGGAASNRSDHQPMVTLTCNNLLLIYTLIYAHVRNCSFDSALF